MSENPQLTGDALLISKQELGTLTVPGPLVRPAPTFNLGVPTDWVITEAPGTVFVMGTEASFEGPWSNVLVKHERVPADTTLDDVARSTWAELLVDHPEVEVLDETAVDFAETHYIRTVKLHMEGWGEVNRTDSFVFAPVEEAPTGDLIHFIWLNALEAAPVYGDLYAAILASLEFT